jgi:hypothetical protein
MEMRPKLRELERWRHKRIAHLELKGEVLAKVKTSRSYRIRITQIEEIIGSCWDVYNQISVAYDSSVFADPHLTYRSDVKRSLSKVLEGMELYWKTLNRNA